MDQNKDLELSNGVVSVSVKCGEVIGQQKWSETEVHSSGGGGHVGPQGGHVASPTITSTIKTKFEFWIREDDGRESPIELTNKSFTALEGQKVWIAWAANKKNLNTSTYLFAYNNASKRYFDLVSDLKSWLYSSKLLKKPLVYRLLTTWLSFFIGLIIGLVFLPLFSRMNSSLTFVDAIGRIFDSFSFPSSLQQSFSILPNLVSSNFFTVLFVILGSWLISSLILRIFGRLFFLRFWERKQLDTIYKNIFSACNELAGDYAEENNKR